MLSTVHTSYLSKIGQNFAFFLQKSTPAWKTYTIAGRGGSDKYEIWYPLFFTACQVYWEKNNLANDASQGGCWNGGVPPDHMCTRPPRRKNRIAWAFPPSSIPCVNEFYRKPVVGCSGCWNGGVPPDHKTARPPSRKIFLLGPCLLLLQVFRSFCGLYRKPIIWLRLRQSTLSAFYWLKKMPVTYKMGRVH